VLRGRAAGVVLRAGGEGHLLRRHAPRARLRVRVAVAATLAGAGPHAAPDARSASAWAELRERLQAFVARRVANAADVEDIVQRVFLQLHRSESTLVRREAVHAWLYRTARNAIVDHYRAAARRELPSGAGEEIEALQGAGAPRAERDELRQIAACLEPMIARLPDEYRRAVVATELEGRPQHEVARAEGVSLSGMKSRVQRARRRLKQLLLDCCRIELDRRGGVTDCEPRQGDCGRCAGPLTEPGSGEGA
jgi:RNA polymerase sigma-70 factor (ECF subfamily)